MEGIHQYQPYVFVHTACSQIEYLYSHHLGLKGTPGRKDTYSESPTAMRADGHSDYEALDRCDEPRGFEGSFTFVTM